MWRRGTAPSLLEALSQSIPDLEVSTGPTEDHRLRPRSHLPWLSISDEGTVLEGEALFICGSPRRSERSHPPGPGWDCGSSCGTIFETLRHMWNETPSIILSQLPQISGPDFMYSLQKQVWCLYNCIIKALQCRDKSLSFISLQAPT